MNLDFSNFLRPLFFFERKAFGRFFSLIKSVLPTLIFFEKGFRPLNSFLKSSTPVDGPGPDTP